MIRRATPEDVPQLVAMGEMFYRESPYCRFDLLPFEPDTTSENFASFCESDTAAFLVMEHEGQLIGGLLGLVTASWFSRSLLAVELAWWMDPPYRKGLLPIRLYHAFRRWAIEKGARLVSLGRLEFGPTDAARGERLLDGLGLRCIEHAHVGVL